MGALCYSGRVVSDSVIGLGKSVAAPGSFTALMALYESNYVRLGWLIPDVRGLSGSVTSHVPNDFPLNLAVTDQAPYTTTLRLTYFFREEGQVVADPDLLVRVYHDARMAEVMTCAEHHRHDVLRGIDLICRREPGKRWMRNMMLNKWLEYCESRGHGFSGYQSTDILVSEPQGSVQRAATADSFDNAPMVSILFR